MEVSRNSMKRQVAYKVRIKDLLEGQYVKNEGDWAPNYIQMVGRQVSRVNVIGAIVLKPEDAGEGTSMVVDDGTGKILVKTFENSGFFDKVNIGDVALVVGRPREFGVDKYLVPEILKKLNDNEWIKVRQLELENIKDIPKEEKIEELSKSGSSKGLENSKTFQSKEEKIEENKVEEEKVVVEKNAPESPTDKIFNLIKKEDLGDGAYTEDIISKSQVTEAEQIIKKLLEEGEVFEVKPGRLKVLE